MKMLECCFNWKVVAGLAAIALGVALWQPHLFIVALPTLALAICPLSMGIMFFNMWRAQGQTACSMNQAAQSATTDVEDADTDHAALADLQVQLAQVRERQAALAEQLAALHAEPSPVIAEAEAVAHSADARWQASVRGEH